jgi:hypothetical protein
MHEPATIQISIQRMICTSCGAEANAACNCGVGYVPKTARAAEAIKANPEKSNRAIAAEVGADEKTVRKARADQSAPETVTGKDGKKYPAKQAKRAEEDDAEPEPGCSFDEWVGMTHRISKLEDRVSSLTEALNAKEVHEGRAWPADMTSKQIKRRDGCLKNIAAWQRELEKLYGEVTGCPSWRVEIATKDGIRLGNGARFGTRGEAEFYHERFAAFSSSPPSGVTTSFRTGYEPCTSSVTAYR